MALEGATQLLDFSQKLDINMLDNVIKTMYHGSGPQVSFQIDNGLVMMIIHHILHTETANPYPLIPSFILKSLIVFLSDYIAR